MASVLEVQNIDATLKLQRQFLICDFCFWAASAISTRRHDIMVCPQCEALISRIPLTEKESFTFNYDKKRGVELDFASSR